ncbi:MAG: transglutaminase domain-containing protein [Ignavibacteria bacterium]
MKKNILLIFIGLSIITVNTLSQFTKGQIEELTAFGISEAIEPKDEAIIKAAAEITRDYDDSDNIQSICALFDNVYKKWNYQGDPGGIEYFEKAGVSVYTYTGDCDDYATLMVSLVKAAGGEGRVVCVSGHAYPEMYLGSALSDLEIESVRKKINLYYENKGSKINVKYLNYHSDSNGSNWLNLDYQDRYPGGHFAEYSASAEHLVIYPDGSYELAYLNK